MSILKKHQYRKKPKGHSEPSAPIAPKQPASPTKKTVVPIVKQHKEPVGHMSPSVPTSDAPFNPHPTPNFEDEKKAFRAELERERQQTLDAAYQQGIEKGKAEGLRAYEAKSLELVAGINALGQEKKRVLNQAKREILNLSTQIAEQILKSEISFNQAVSLNIVSEALGKITDKDHVTIRVAQADFEYINLNKDYLKEHIGDIKNLQIIEDQHASQGGCMIETDLGYIDATIETKVAAIKQAIFAVLEDEEHGDT